MPDHRRAPSAALLRFLRGLPLLCLALGALPPLSWAQAEPPIPFVDAHVHLNDVAAQLALMDRFGATQAVVFWGGRSSNESVLAAARSHPGRFIPFASISPERRAYRPAWDGEGGGEGAAIRLLAQLDTLLASGQYHGIGEINAVHFPSAGFAETDYSPDGPMMDGILALARKHRVPVLLHVEITRLAALSRLLQRFADVPVIWAHGGYTPLFLARRMLEQHPNLHYELSARTWPQHPRSPDYTLLRDGREVWPAWLQLIEALPERFIVGTDASHRSAASEEMKAASVQNLLAQLSSAARDKVARENILALTLRRPGLDKPVPPGEHRP